MFAFSVTSNVPYSLHGLRSYVLPKKYVFEWVDAPPEDRADLLATMPAPLIPPLVPKYAEEILQLLHHPVQNLIKQADCKYRSQHRMRK